VKLFLPPDCAPEARHLLGISGGRDSVALLECLLAAGYRNLVLCHLNHRLRGIASEEDARLVRDLAQEQGLDFEIGEEEVAARATRERVSLEVAARRARIAFFQQCAQRQGTDRLFLAHHADDQVETILIHLLRATGLRGLSGMKPVTRLGGLTVIRPFLAIPRDQIPQPRRFHEDESNAGDEFLRNRLRHHAIPVLREQFGREFGPGLCRMAEVLREEDRLLQTLAEAAFAAAHDGAGGMQVSQLRSLPLALQRRVIRRWLQDAAVPGTGFREVETVRALYGPPSAPAKANLPAGWHIRRRAGRLFLETPPPDP